MSLFYLAVNEEVSDVSITKYLKTSHIMSRKLRVTESYKNKKFVPQVNLCGKWLAAAGFEKGQEVEIIIQENQLIIVSGKGGQQ